MIRDAIDDDVPELVEMAAAFHAESNYARQGIPFDRNSFAQNVSLMIHSPLGVVLIGPGKGFAEGVVVPLYFNAMQIAGQELLLWARPGERRGFGKDLFRALEEAFIARGATLLMMTATEACRPAAVGRVYEAAGYKLADHVYTKVLMQ